MAQALKGYDPVTIDMRALVDKVLARYSAKFSVFRELLQNSDDAGCDSAEICFETVVSPPDPEVAMSAPAMMPDMEKTDVVQWTYRNHGKLFRPQDWKRLPRIALGNPDPTKIGAFGVGFFSVFSVTDKPCVSSGGKEMEFRWDDANQLHYRFDDLPDTANGDLWSTFKIPLREPAPMPPLSELMQFLASSITFMVHLENVAVFFNHHCVGRISKAQEEPQNIGSSILTDLQWSGPANVMEVRSVQQHPIRLEAKLPQIGLCETTDITMYTAEVEVTPKGKLFEELERCMKKAPPTHLKYRLIYTNKEEHDQVREQHHEFPSPFQRLRADLDGAVNTRIYIGHATAQTTGIGGHMASHFIPTVERESIDLVDINVGAWNRELLHIGGILCRVVYELELSKIRDSWGEQPSRELQDQLHERFLHVLKFFTFHHSTPSEAVARLLADSFYGCSKRPIRVLSSAGVHTAPDVRQFDSVLAQFLTSVPMLSEYVTQNGARSIAELPDKHKISAITQPDILEDLRGHSLDTEQLVAFLSWWISLGQDDPMSKGDYPWNAATLHGNTGEKIHLSSITSFVDSTVLGRHIPSDGPLPLSLIPLGVSKHFDSKKLTSFGWTEFTVASWLQHLSDLDVMSMNEKYNFTRSTDWAGRVLTTLAHVWQELPGDIQRESRNTFRSKPCIPTSQGLCCPECSYIPIRDDARFQQSELPIVSCEPGFELDTDMEKCLVSLGVQKDPPVQFLLDQLLLQGNWTALDLIKYLVQEERSLNDADVLVLKSSEIFTMEDDDDEETRYSADALYPPVEIFRNLKLPIIKWSGKSEWRDASKEARLLYRLGLNDFPPLPKIIELCSSMDTGVQDTAFTHFCKELQSRYSAYKPVDFQDVEFIPADSNDGTSLKKLDEVYVKAQWKSLGFSVVPERYSRMPWDQLGVMQHPPISKILDLLENNPPRDEQTARRWFEILFDHISAFSQSDRTTLSGLSFVPTSSSSAATLRPPNKCYLDQGSQLPLYKKLFVFVSFGDKANDFLRACGLKNQVVTEDIVEALIENPQQFVDSAGSYEDFLAELRKIAFHRRDISNATLQKMNNQHALLGVGPKKAEGEDKWPHEYKFLTSQEITIVDDTDDCKLFSDCLFTAPREEVLERFYDSLGCNYLSAVVEEEFCGLDEIPAMEKTCLEVRSRILQRLPLFMQQHTDTKVKVQLNADNFRVKACRSIRVLKTLKLGDEKRSRDARAIARHIDNHIELWISKAAKRDMYEVATSLCRVLFGTTKTNTTLLLEKVLSADLEGLARRGFLVDQLPQEHKRGHRHGHGRSKMGPKHWSKSETLPGRSEAIVEASSHLHTTDTPIVKANEVSINAPSNETLDNTEQPTARPSRTLTGVIPQSDIRENAEAAINGCGSETLVSPAGRRQPWSNDFCKLSVDVKALRYVDNVKDIRVYVHEGVSDINTFMSSEDGPLARFVDIISTLCKVYRISETTLCIFYDVSGGCIAFNNKRVIYLNLRYFKAWHDKQVDSGNRQDALMWWFLALAHEIAHNEILQHNADHEFLFSAICESRLAKFSQLLETQPTIQPAIQPTIWLRYVLWLTLPVIIVLLAYVAKRMTPVANTLH